MKILVIPDTQAKPGVALDHMAWAGMYAAKHLPDVIVHLGDNWDMPSLCTYDKGKKGFVGRTYMADIEAGNLAMDTFMGPIKEERQRRKYKQWHPRLVFTEGNHEYRIERAVEYQPELEGLLTYDHFNLDEHGWEVHPYQQVVTIEGVAFSHFFTSGVMGRPVTSATALLRKKMMSCVMGHVQDRDIAEGKRGDGRRLTAIFAGIFYQHEENYLGPQGNQSWRGIWMLNEVNDGSFDAMPVSLGYLRNKFGG